MFKNKSDQYLMMVGHTCHLVLLCLHLLLPLPCPLAIWCYFVYICCYHFLVHLPSGVTLFTFVVTTSLSTCHLVLLCLHLLLPLPCPLAIWCYFVYICCYHFLVHLPSGVTLFTFVVTTSLSTCHLVLLCLHLLLPLPCPLAIWCYFVYICCYHILMALWISEQYGRGNMCRLFNKKNYTKIKFSF